MWGRGRSRPSTVYASVHAKAAANGFYRSDDAGSSWKLVNSSNGTAWYYSQVRCDPTDAEHVVRLNVGSTESYDGGKSWRPYAGGGGEKIAYDGERDGARGSGGRCDWLLCKRRDASDGKGYCDGDVCRRW